MKKKNPTIEEVKVPQEKLMTRKQAIKRSGYMALSAATMMMLLNTNASAQGSGVQTTPVNPSGTSEQKKDGIWEDQ